MERLRNFSTSTALMVSSRLQVAVQVDLVLLGYSSLGGPS